ncbi:ATP-binding protein [Streptomyces zagrosensis]|uniref:Anti-sigma regulatory factor (Ser/Thr protein kinase) n=1 Tax=Streptomyces zagrosensis TaxID=1042984 RepID=A0A7W9Q8N0_9ACTN|nr:ATP-binding protein [Streptomyces zagrosensis]MBB5935379.1 anti-sigma regulatory factor (Ser/Thr protein kinase) [Streptomyces zagrosensis]
MISSTNRHCTVELQALPERIGQVRRIVSAQLRYWHLDQLIEPATLGVSELLTNVYVHAEPDKRCTVDIVWVLNQLTISVRDGDPREPTASQADPFGTHGRGLALIAAVSASWGVRTDDGGKTVWFALPARQTATRSMQRLPYEPSLPVAEPARGTPLPAVEPVLRGMPLIERHAVKATAAH